MSTLERAIDLRELRKKSHKPKDKVIRDLRVYYTGLPKKALYPYDYQYSEIFKNLLKKKKFACPTYHHLYIQVEKTIEECLQRSIPIENWYIYGIAVIDYDNYLKQSIDGKEKIVFDLIVKGLKDIADIDGLDSPIIDETIDEIKHNGLDTELEYTTVENKNYILKVTYISKSMEEESPIYLTLFEKVSNNHCKVQIGRVENSVIYYWLQKITLTKTQIKIKSSNSAAADVYLENKPRNMTYEIKELLN
jgi:hypothetical protein